jgi:translocation and assembly module TamB
LRLTADVPSLAGGSVRLSTAANLDVAASTLTVSSLQAGWKTETVRLLAPVRLNFADGVAIDRLRIGLRQAVLDVSGKVGNTLALTVQLRGLPADLAAIVAPDFAADGTLQADAQLAGTPAQPTGTVRLSGSGLRLRGGPGRALPAANVTATAVLDRGAARLDAKMTAGSSQLTLAGTAPLAASGALDLHAGGSLDLTLLDPLLAAEGRRVRGQVTLTAAITGRATAPEISGRVLLANGEVNDYAQGIRISAIAARLTADGDTLHVEQFSGRAGQGTLGASGTIGLHPPMPINLHITANNASPLASDLLTAVLDTNIDITGEVTSALTVGGNVHIRRADIRVPERLPTGVATLPVRVAGAPPPPAAPGPTITLNLTIDAPEQIFVRGRGLDAELGGHLVLTGTAARPIPAGGLTLRRGQISLAGHTLQFTSGTIEFNGGSIGDPTLNLVSTTTSGTDTDTLTIGGTASQPKITLSSSAGLPQDEILAHLLFGTNVTALNPFQLAEIAAALASLSGAAPGLSNPLEGVRQSLGLDVLSVGSSAKGSPSLQAGRYVAPGVYVGAQQSATGGGTQATVQIDLTKGLKLQSTIGSGSTSATGASSTGDGASVGLTYQFEY